MHYWRTERDHDRVRRGEREDDGLKRGGKAGKTESKERLESYSQERSEYLWPENQLSDSYMFVQPATHKLFNYSALIIYVQWQWSAPMQEVEGHLCREKDMED